MAMPAWDASGQISRPRGSMALAITIFVSAFLLFNVQLILGKWLLPWFGGTPSVWTTCMLFFQVLLLAGYGYARALDVYVRPDRQGLVHATLLGVAGLVLAVQWWFWGAPLLPDALWRPAPQVVPWTHLLATLGVAVGLPFLLLAATSPLLQRWYSLMPHRGSPYRLYALSNAGSLLGLLSYPFLIEVRLDVPVQALGWGLLFVGVVLGSVLTAGRLARETRPTPGAATQVSVEEARDRQPGTPLQWIGLSACASAMLLAVTNVVSQDIAVVPLLWVLPLTLYLLTFILSFDHPRWYHRRFFMILLVVLVTAVTVVTTSNASPGLPEQLLLYGGVLFVFCMLCHGELYRSRPELSRLTSFYLMVALGGAIGGGFVSLGAPLLFKGFWEFPVALLAGLVLLALRFLGERGGAFVLGHWSFGATVAGVLGAVVAGTHVNVSAGGHGGALRLLLLTAAVFVAAQVLFAAMARLGANRLAGHRLWGGALHACVLFLATALCAVQVLSTYANALWVSRNFYGVVRVLEFEGGAHMPPYREMVHGQVQHGFQFFDSEWQDFPTSYYSPDGGGGLALAHHPRRQADAPLRVGVIGLGIGTLAAYGEDGDCFVQYEINPEVARLARGKGDWFSFVADSPARHEIVGGDARLALEAELESLGGRDFDVLVLDAFSGDAVPAHLLTREAFALYAAHLADDDAVIATHVSNVHLELPRVVLGGAEDLGWEAYFVRSGGSGPRPFASDWVILAAPGNVWVQDSPIAREATAFPAGEAVLWTDRYSSLFRILRNDSGL